MTKKDKFIPSAIQARYARKPLEQRKAEKQAYLEDAEEKLFSKLDWLLEQKLKLAAGVSLLSHKNVADIISRVTKAATPDLVAKILETAKTLYTQQPDSKSIEYLIDRVMGKPTEQRDVTLDGTIKVGRIVIDKSARGELVSENDVDAPVDA